MFSLTLCRSFAVSCAGGPCPPHAPVPGLVSCGTLGSLCWRCAAPLIDLLSPASARPDVAGWTVSCVWPVQLGLSLWVVLGNITATGVQTSRSSPSATHRNHIYRSIIKRNTRRTHRAATRSWSHKGNHHPLVVRNQHHQGPNCQVRHGQGRQKAVANEMGSPRRLNVALDDHAARYWRTLLLAGASGIVSSWLPAITF